MIGGGPFKVIEHPHFWKVAVLFILIVGSIWAWRYLHIQPQLEAESAMKQTPRSPGAILPR